MRFHISVADSEATAAKDDVDMEIHKFGRTALHVPVIGVGTWRAFDVREARDEQERGEVVTAALDAGANLFDSAAVYGAAERVLGQALRGRRERAIVATKIWAHSAADFQAQMGRAMDFFQGRVEIYQIHNLVGWEICLPLLEELKARGQIKAIGITPYAHSALPKMREILETGRVDVIQVPYSAADRVEEHGMLELAREFNLGVMVMRPLGGGELAQREPPREEWKGLRLERFGVETWAQVLLKWVVSDPRVHTAIPATSSVSHMRQNAEAGNPPWFDEDTREAIARLAARYNQ